MINVVNKICEYQRCSGKRAIFNIIGQKPKFCGEHATENMINLSAKKCKGVDGKKCYTIPIYIIYRESFLFRFTFLFRFSFVVLFFFPPGLLLVKRAFLLGDSPKK
jgi:hypothetical protein